MLYRTHNCGELRISNCNKKVILSGWVNKIRIMKNYYFIDIRDFYGITQLLIKKNKIKVKIKNEYVIRIKGIVVKRKYINKKISTGDIEILVKKIYIINKSDNLPIFIDKNYKYNNKKLLLKYRYLYLRNLEIKNNLIIKSKILNIIRNFFIKNNFLEIETPFLVKSTSEGSRDFIIPYRKKHGLFYSLPQSPQTFKQLLMIGGIDKYYQIVKCFRDEDLRKDRQPEFLQLDIEMSFVNIKKIIYIIKKFIKYLLYKLYNIKFINIKKFTYKKIIKLYNTDKPDLRYKIFNIFIKKKYIINKYNKKYKIFSLILPNYFNIINVNINDLIFLLSKYFKKKHILIFDFKNKININKINIFKFKKYIYKIIYKNLFSKYDILLILIISRKYKYKNIYNIIKKKINNFLLKSKYNKNIYIPLLIYNYPLFKYNLNNKKYESFHHPFTKPKKNINNIKKLYKIKAESYDLIINGLEIGSGSIRIDNYNLQRKIFLLLGLSNKEIDNNFGFFLNSLKYGTPPHGGIGIGIDRLILSLLNKKDIKDVIAFPKNFNSKDLMIKSPSKIDKYKLLELGININKKK
ncbi:MAG: aspartate--tRNA ligase [Candidatus Shikimatogenerans sp. JK-2022]|nr:aspartate--tRNA ligase [Candidatus Shikimatogenerans bostrichidophilus]